MWYRYKTIGLQYIIMGTFVVNNLIFIKMNDELINTLSKHFHFLNDHLCYSDITSIISQYIVYKIHFLCIRCHVYIISV